MGEREDEEEREWAIAGDTEFRRSTLSGLITRPCFTGLVRRGLSSLFYHGPLRNDASSAGWEVLCPRLWRKVQDVSGGESEEGPLEKVSHSDR